MTPLVRLVAVLAVALSAALVPSPSAAQTAPAPSPPSAPTAGQAGYTPVAPVRLLDTRTAGGAVGPGGTVPLQVAGVRGVPADATAVVLSVTAVGASASTDVQVYPAPTGQGSSNLVVPKGGSASNLVVVGVGEGGQVVLRNSGGSVQLIADLAGYYARGSGATFVPVSPERLLDTRDTASPLGDGEVRTLKVAGVGRVPADATAVAVNLTSVDASATTDVRAYPAGPAVPDVSNSNPGVGRPTSVAAIVAVGEDGAIALRNSRGRVSVIVDLAGWFVPSSSASPSSVFHAVTPRRLLDTRATDDDAVREPVASSAPRDLVVAGAGVVPAQATGVALTITALGATTGSDVRVYPVPRDGTSVPGTSNLNVRPGALVANTVHVAVGKDGSVRIRNLAGSVHVVVDLAGWFGPTGRGWDISWPQCTTEGATTSRLPVGGAFAVVGLTRSAPFSDNECFATQWRWASSLPAEPAVYMNTNAPGPDRGTPDSRVWAEVCGTGAPTPGCGRVYGERIAAYALERMPTTPTGGRPQVWMDVEGPYPGGPYWLTGGTSFLVNRDVIQGVVDGLRRAGYRFGTYSDRGSVTGNNNDWVAITGGWRLTQMQNWVFRSPDADPRTVCGPEHSFSGGPVVMAQVQPATNPGVAYDVDELC